MKSFLVLSFLPLQLLFTPFVFYKSSKEMKDYLGIPGPVSFNNKSYSLSWSSHPAPNFYKHEYIGKGDEVEKFHDMILIDVMTGNLQLKDIVTAKIEELKKIKAQNPVVNYQLLDNSKTGEYMIDFILTANGNDGKMNIAEHNIYRYKKFADNVGHNGVLLFGVSARSYGNEIGPFLNGLKTTKNDLIKQVAQYSIPAINIKE